jgi:RNA polymerase sigma factor (sigma-70 family)
LPERTLSADDVQQLYDQHGPALLAYACSFVSNVAVGEDAVHHVFLRLLERDTVVPDVPAAYLYRAVRNAALNACRNGRRDVPLETQSIWLEHRDGNREASLALQAALRDLPEEQREVVMMRIWSGMTFEEISAAMQRATKLPDCDWGVEYDLGPRASIAYAPKARVLARLNTLYGVRLAAKGDTQKAVDTWLAGIRFSQHLISGGSLIFSLVAKMALVSNFHALAQAAQSGALSDAQRKQIEVAVRALPETGFAWDHALRYEEDGLDVAIAQMKQAPNPFAYYQQIMGQPQGWNGRQVGAASEAFSVPTASEVAAFHKLIASAEETLRLPPDKAQDKLKALQDSVKTLHFFYQQTTPSFTHINDARAEVQAARDNLLQALSAR